MGKTYNPVASCIIHKRLEDAGFERGLAGKEVFYEIRHRVPCLKVRVYTSAKQGVGIVAEKGKDAIRLVLLYENEAGKTFCLKKGKRVYRVGTTKDILDRMIERARELYGFANEICKVPGCPKCKGPCYPGGTKCATYCHQKAKK